MVLSCARTCSRRVGKDGADRPGDHVAEPFGTWAITCRRICTRPTAYHAGCSRAVVGTYLPMLPQMMGWK